jgi:hypothetical protein
MSASAGHRRRVRPERRRFLTLLAVLVAAAVPASLAWACNPNAGIFVNPNATAGSQLVISGTNFNANASVGLAISPGGGGTSVTTSSIGGFRVTINAPSTPGTYNIQASETTAEGAFSVGPKAVVTVTSPAASAPSGARPGAGSKAPSTTRPTAPSAGKFKEPEVPRARGFARGDNSNGGRQRSTAPAGGGINTAARLNAGEGVVKSAGGSTVFAGSVTRADRVASTSGARSGAARRSGRAAAKASLPKSSAVGDLWTGFKASNAPGLRAKASEPAPSGGAGSLLGLGLGLVALGAVALIGGLALSGARKRKAVAR